MEAFAVPLRLLADDAAWFARDRQLRLLHVMTTADLADAALDIVMGQEFHADNRCPFVRLDDPFSDAEPGWAIRAERVRQAYAALRAALAEGGTSLPLLPLAPSMRDPLALFAAQLRQVVTSLAPVFDGLVMVLAPTRVDDPAVWSQTLRSLIATQGLSEVRWVAFDRDQPTLTDTVRVLGAAALEVRCVVDDLAVDRDMAAMLDRAASAEPGAPGPALMGAAWPVVRPPMRPGAVEMTPEKLKEALALSGITPPITAGDGQRLRTLILRAVQALKAQRGPDAIRIQREARDLCDAIGLSKESVLMELVLGAYLVQLGQRPLAMETYRKVAARAEGGGMPKEASQAQLALAALWLVDKRPDLASVAYGQAAELARKGNEPILAIEAYRLCGHHCADRNVKVLAWRRALAVAGDLDPPEAKASSAAEVARELADVLRKAGLHAQAAQMDQEGIVLESGERAIAAPTTDPPAVRRTSGAV
jgi:hypothetical protein